MTLPVITLPSEKDSIEHLLSSVLEVFGFEPETQTSNYFTQQMERWLESSTPEQLSDLSDIIEILGPLDGLDEDTDDPGVIHERGVIRDIMNATLVDGGRRAYAHDMLAVRSALHSNYTLSAERMMPFFIGAISKDGHVLAPEKRLPVEQLVSVTRFAHEVTDRLRSIDNNPISSTYVYGIDASGEKTSIHAAEYRSQELFDLVATNADRVDELIEIAVNRKSCDPSMLQEILRDDYHPSMSSGVL